MAIRIAIAANISNLDPTIVTWSGAVYLMLQPVETTVTILKPHSIIVPYQSTTLFHRR